MRASYIENSLQKKRGLFKKTGLREGSASMIIFKNPEHISEMVGHIFWFWSIEVIRRDLRNRITKEPDAEIPLNAPFR